MSFGKNRLVRDGEKALVAFSGGLSSTAMLHLVQEVSRSVISHNLNRKSFAFGTIKKLQNSTYNNIVVSR